MRFFLVGRIGFEPMKAQGQLIYSQPRLTTSLPAHVATKSILRDFVKQNALRSICCSFQNKICARPFGSAPHILFCFLTPYYL